MSICEAQAKLYVCPGYHRAVTAVNMKLRPVVVQFGKISHFVRDDRTVTLFVISSGRLCEKSETSTTVG
jgi:hypothetical protein